MNKSTNIPDDLTSLPRSWGEAKVAGAKRYFTGKPCKRGHIAPKWTCDRKCTACSTEKNWAKRLAKMESTESTEAFWNADAKKRKRDPIRRLESERERNRKRQRPKQLRVDRRPPNQSPEERRGIEALDQQAKAHGMVLDHVVAFMHPRLAGLHTLANVQVIEKRANLRKHNRLEMTDADVEDYIRAGMAVRWEDVDVEGTKGRCGKVDWGKYPQHCKKHPDEGTALHAAKMFLLDTLREGARPSKDVADVAYRQGIAYGTLRQAKQELGVQAYHGGAMWFWKLRTYVPDATRQT